MTDPSFMVVNGPDPRDQEIAELQQKLSANKERERVLREALASAKCRCSKAVDAKCPGCGSDLHAVRNNSALNDEQFDSVKAGEWFCGTCKDPTIKSGHKYYWARELPVVTYQQCDRCAALASTAEPGDSK